MDNVEQKNVDNLRKRIVFLIPSLEFGGGAERIASILSHMLSKYYEIIVITFYDTTESYNCSGTHIKLLPKATIFNKLRLPFLIFKILKRISPHLIISFIDYANSLTILTQIVFGMNTPLFICNHTNPLSHYQKSDRYLNSIIPILYSSKKVTKIITIADHIKEVLVNSYGINHKIIKTIYNGIDLNEIKTLKTQEIKNTLHRSLLENKEYVKFISMGRLIEIKGHKYLISAFAQVKKEIPNSALFILGDGPLNTSLKEFAVQKKVDKEIYFLGLKKNPYKYLAHADIFVLPSLIEGLPMSIIEAMACELPIIATKCKSGIEEIVEEGTYGILVPPKDSSSLAKKMILLSKDKSLRDTYSELSLKRANYFDIHKVLEKWIRTIENNI
ncbi:MAG: putative enzyme [Promethearchaeota archaeon]|nr:MAG: putative enzyme [Candidatus Lokiarchaeota archaeon]